MGLRSVWLLVLLAAGAKGLRAQAGTDAPSPNQPTYTLHADARVVLTDVTVTDAAGRPVHGLARAAFHLSDNKRAVELVSFEEHAGGAEAEIHTGPTAAHVYSNDFLLHPPAVFNVVMLNTATMNIAKQVSATQ